MALAARINTYDAVPLDVRAALNMLGITAWNPDSIKKYMAAEKAKYRPNIWYYVDKVIRPDTVDTMVMTAFIITCAVLIACGISGIALFFKLSFTSWSLLGHLALFAVGGIVLTGLLYWLDDAMLMGRFRHIQVRGEAVWGRFEFKEYRDSNTIPGLADSIVSRVRSVFPNSTFYVDELYQGVWSLDPVLWMQADTDGEKIAVLVWDIGGQVVPAR